jgi:hypothetical protein
VLVLMGWSSCVGGSLGRGIYVVSQRPDFGVAVGWGWCWLGAAWDCLVAGARYFGVSDV